MIGAEAVTETIVRSGIGTVFALAGAQHTKLLDSLQQAGIRIVGNRSEDAVVEAADGYARITGRPGVGLIISGQGVVNSVAGFATAYEAGSPVVILMARPPFGDDPRDAAYHASTAVVDPVSKWHALVQRPDDLADYLQAAIEIAQAPRPGPVVLSIPADFLATAVTDADPRARARAASSRRGHSRPAEPEVAAAVDLIRTAERPIVIAGTGFRRSADAAGVAGLATLVDRHNLPVLLQSEANGLLARDGTHVFGWPVAQTAVSSADVVLLLGCPLDHRLGGGRAPRFAPDAKLIQVDCDPVELGRGRALDIAIAAHPGTALADFGAALAAIDFRAPDPGWLREHLASRLAAIEAVPSESASGLHPYAVARGLRKVVTDPVVYVGDGADVLNWMHGQLDVPAGSAWMDHHPLGSMGVGLPLAIGACAAEQELHPDPSERRPVILITGDGALGYHLSELETASRCSLPIRVIVSNDGAWGTERHGQIKNIGHSVNTELSVARYDQAAEGLGCHGILVRTKDDLDDALRVTAADGGPVLVNVLVDRNSGWLRKNVPLLEMVFYDEFALQQATRA